uniref:Uncharacterized protein n=1 Tax=Melopsittacus undulatus TaxID=13146 RepID=A0A8V5G731_MELUD
IRQCTVKACFNIVNFTSFCQLDNLKPGLVFFFLDSVMLNPIVLKNRHLVKIYSEKDHSNMDCFACFIFSHGEKDKIKGVDDQFVNIKDLVACFSGSNCPSLAGKPKLFFIQVCQERFYSPRHIETSGYTLECAVSGQAG